MKNNKKNWLSFFAWVVITIVYVITYSRMIRQQKEIEALKQEIQAEYIDLDSCPFCSGKAKIITVNDSFYIKCMDCELKTDYFDSKAELVEYWSRGGIF